MYQQVQKGFSLSKLPKIISLILTLLLLNSFLIIPTQSTNNFTSTFPEYDCYSDSETINQTMEDLLSQYPALVKLESIGKSYDGNLINVLTLSNQDVTGNKPRLVVVSGLRANAFAPVELSLSFAEYLLQNYGLDADSTWILDYLSLHLILLANPDGRLVAESQAQDGEDITWQNNTHLDHCSTDYGGVSLNLNFSFEWQPASCGRTYPGPEAESEPETQAISSYLEDLALSEEPILLINLDAGENLILMPYQYNDSAENPHLDELFTLANKIAFGTASTPILPTDPNNIQTSGTLIDYAFGKLNIPSLTFKMGSEEGGCEVSYCWYFEQELHNQSIQALLRVAKASLEPYNLPFGPETTIENITYNPTYIHLAGSADDYSYYHESSYLDYSYVENLYYSINTPPWDENAILYPVDLVQDPKIDFYSTFETSIPKEKLTTGRNIIFLQSWDSPEGSEESHPGLVSSVFIDIPYKIFLPLLLN